MTYYYRLGSIPHKRHTQFRQPDGSLYHEELMGLRGFSGVESLLYHVRPPTQVRKTEVLCKVNIPFEEQGPLRHRHFRSASIPEFGDAIEGRVPLMGNNDVVMYVARPNRPMTYWYRHGQGDDVLFMHEGTGILETQYGNLRYGPGDYLVIPAGGIWRLLPDDKSHQRMLVVEAMGHIEPPRRYLNNYGPFLQHSPCFETDFRRP